MSNKKIEVKFKFKLYDIILDSHHSYEGFS